MKIQILIFAIILSLIISCNKDQTQNNTSSDQIIFNGYSNIDENGVIITNDTSDWNANDSWNTNELNIFGINSSYKLCTSTQLTTPMIAYPIPNNGVFNLHATLENGSRLAVRIVDKNYKVLLSNDSLYGTAAFDIKGLISNDTARIYYRIINKYCELHGHGDIFVK